MRAYFRRGERTPRRGFERGTSEVARSECHDRPLLVRVYAQDFNLDCTKIVSCGMDHSLKVWDLDTPAIKAAIKASYVLLHATFESTTQTALHFSDRSTIEQQASDPTQFESSTFPSSRRVLSTAITLIALAGWVTCCCQNRRTTRLCAGNRAGHRVLT